MDQPDTEKHFSVIRYYPHPGHGLIKNIIEENLTLSQAEEVARNNPPVSHEEEVVILDQNKPAYDAEIAITTL